MKSTHLLLLISALTFLTQYSWAANGHLKGKVVGTNGAIEYASVGIKSINKGTTTDSKGEFELSGIEAGDYLLEVSYIGYESQSKTISIKDDQTIYIDFQLIESSEALDEVVVVSGTMKEVNRLESPVPVEVYNPAFFKKNPTPNMFEALQNVNGVRPQLNCSVCNTGDIHINGLEGPYTMVLIDGMPIVSSLSTVYGLSGIPNSLIERMEVVKGPASSLYGSEAIGGLINIITKNPQNAPIVSADIMGTSWQEYNTDIGIKLGLGKKLSVLTGLNYYHYDNPIDNNGDNFTDVTLQQRISIFQKYNIDRKDNKLFTIAGRYFYEDRWGGEMQWNESYRGGDEIYGESIYTKRWELISTYQLPTTENLFLSFSFNNHDQDSFYGNTPYKATQRIGFGQLTWDRKIDKHDLLVGTAVRYTYYDDNTSATGGESSSPTNDPSETVLPGVFIQDEYSLTPNHKVLGGLRYDYHQDHGSILTPRFAYKWKVTDSDLIRINTGTGFRVVNLFSEDHAALTGAREVEIPEELKPERSWNVNLNYIKKMYLNNGGAITLDASTWYTYFHNVILPDYDTDISKIIYDNLDGHAISQGASLNLDAVFTNGWSGNLGVTVMDVSTHEEGIRTQQALTESWSGVWGLSYIFNKLNLSIDYSGNIYGPMDLPHLGENDIRQENSPIWSIQNIQFTYSGFKNIQVYSGVKNLLDWTPNEGNPFIIARAHDPFENENFSTEIGNPNALPFDPTYVYGPNQGIRVFAGIRYTLP